VTDPHPVYRRLVGLYPREFRRHHGDDLVQLFSDLVDDRGAAAAWTLTGVDLIVTLPRYRLETIMSQHHSATTLNIVIALLAAGGLASMLAGFSPGLVLLVAAAVLAVAQRSTLARALRTPDSSARRRRLTISATLIAVFVASYTSYILLIGDTWTVRETVLAAIGTPAMVGGVVFLIAGLLTPKGAATTPSQQPVEPRPA
jgi:hypothetical protein